MGNDQPPSADATRPIGAAAASLPIAVVIPAFNRARELSRCLAGVWSQVPALPTEILVIDDGSHDDTAEVAAAHGAKVIRHAENRGLAAARNSGLEAADSEWVAFLDSDDEWLPHHLASLWAVRDGHALVGGSAMQCGDKPDEDRFHGPPTRQPLVLRSPDRLLSTYNLFTVSGCMIRREVALALGGFRPVWGVEDLDLWVRVLERHTAVCSPQVSVVYHVHGDQMSTASARMNDGHRDVARAYARRNGTPSVLLDRWDAGADWDDARAALVRGDLVAGLRGGIAAVAGVQRSIGVSLLVWSRIRARYLKSSVGRDGGASVVVRVTDQQQRRAVLEALHGRSVRDLSERSITRALLAFITRPAGLVVVSSPTVRALLRVVGVRAVTASTVINIGV